MSTDKRLELLDDPENLIIFTTVPTGLGHLRVTDAVSSGLPKGERAVLLGVHNRSATFLHRLSSISRFGRKVGEWLQYGRQEVYFSNIFIFLLGLTSGSIYQQLTTLLDSRVKKPKKVLIVSTHCILAHQISKVKKRIEAEYGVKIFLVVVVTDDSPQFIWYVANTDLTFVPSSETKEILLDLSRKNNLAKIEIVVNPYPVDPELVRAMTQDEQKEREHQLLRDSATIVNVSIPVSGAAVGLLFDKHLIEKMQKKNRRYKFFIVSKKAAFTRKFLSDMGRKDHIAIYSSEKDREVVDFYEDVFDKNVISLEITKPSEQAFKTLLPPNTKGGVIMLFTLPVGRQEYDNLNFMERHNLIPDMELQQKLWKAAEMSISIGRGQEEINLEALGKFRGFRLPIGSEACSVFIEWCLREGIFAEMLKYRLAEGVDKAHRNELGGDGVYKFWQKVAKEFLQI